MTIDAGKKLGYKGLHWEPDGKYAIRSGDFVITKNFTSDGWIYLAFYRRELIAREKSAEAAKAACEAHNGK